jgi:hypothetical protein
VQLQAVTLAAKLLVLSASTSAHHNATPTPQLGQPTSNAAHTIALLAQYIFAQAAASPMFYDVRDRARTLGALVRGVNMDVYRASVASASSFSAASASNALAHGGHDGGNEGMEVSAEGWDRQVHAHALRTTFTNGHGVDTTWDENDTRDDDAVAGGVILRVEQVRVVLFEGKIVARAETNALSKGFGRLTCFHFNRIMLRKVMASQFQVWRPHTPWAQWVIWSDGASLAPRIVS